MKIQINTDSTVESGAELVEMVETKVRSALERYGDRLTRIEAHLSDEDGQKTGSDTDKRCLLEARPSGLDPVVVTGAGDTLERACADASRKMQSLLDTTFGRIDDRDGGASIRRGDA
jgi:hypothetical protein